MIIQAKDNVLEKSSQFKSQTFGIKNFNKAFRILIDGIYSDPYGSIMREIASNCIDANKESGTDKNVEITFVNKDALTGDDYTIIFKDYGIGISPDRMFNIFCFLGESTKDSDNEQIGGWGLGSKSPFKYTDTYTVKTVHNKIEYLYTLVINELDVPECNLIYEQPTEAESGTEIIIPVKNYSDFNDFKEAAGKQLLWFKNITFKNYTLDYPKILHEGKRIIILEKALDYYNNSVQNIILGNVPYKYNDNRLHSRVVIKFNIGELQPTASREDLDYNSTTQRNYNLIREEASKELKDYVSQLIIGNDFKSYYETASSLGFGNIEYKGYKLTEFQDAIVYSYDTPYWRNTVRIQKNFLKRIDINSLYYYDSLNIKESHVKNYVKENRFILSIIPQSYQSEIYNILKEIAKPLSSIITPQVIVRQSRKGKITFTDIQSNSVETLEISEFEQKYLKPNQLVVFAKEKSEYLSRYGDYGFEHLKLADSELNKLGVRDNLIHVMSKRTWQKWLLENNSKFRKAFIWELYGTNYIYKLIIKYYEQNNSIAKYLIKYHIGFKDINKIPLDLISEIPILQKQIKIYKTCVKSLFDREQIKLNFKDNDSNN